MTWISISETINVYIDKGYRNLRLFYATTNISPLLRKCLSSLSGRDVFQDQLAAVKCDFLADYW